MKAGRAAVVNNRPIEEVPLEEIANLKPTGKAPYEAEVSPGASLVEETVTSSSPEMATFTEEPVPEYTEEELVSIFTGCDIVVFYEYLKHVAFQDIEESKKIALFKKLMFVPVRTMFPQIVRAAKANDFGGLETLASSSMIDKEKVKRQVEEELKGTLVFPKDTDQMVDMYFAETDPELSELLLTYLIQYDVSVEGGAEMYKYFTRQYGKADDKENKRLMLSRNHVSNIFI